MNFLGYHSNQIYISENIYVFSTQFIKTSLGANNTGDIAGTCRASASIFASNCINYAARN